MQAPLIVFDHTTREVATLATEPRAADKRLADVIEFQRQQVVTSGRPPA